MLLLSPQIEQAIELAALWHGGTFRKSHWRVPPYETPEGTSLRVPVIAHLTATALSVQRAGWKDPVVAAAFLHDTLEDVNRHGEPFRREKLHQLMGEEVARLVAWVSERKMDDDGKPRSWHDRKKEYVQNLEEAPAGAVAISLADKLHNLWTINESLASDVNLFGGDDTSPVLSAGAADQLWFHRAVLEVAEAHDHPRLEGLYDQLHGEVDRFATFLSS